VAAAADDRAAWRSNQSWLSEQFGQQVVVEDRPGAGGTIPTETVVHAAPDGYSLLCATSANAVNTTFYPNLKFDFIRDIAPVGCRSRSRPQHHSRTYAPQQRAFHARGPSSAKNYTFNLSGTALV
jgi:hypothetical protein